LLEGETTIARYKKSNKESDMNKKWIKMAAVSMAVCGLAGIAQAVPITGNITFAGGATLNTSSAGTATEVLTWTGAGGTGLPVVISDDGSFSGIAPGTGAAFASGWHFNSGAVSSLWSVGGFTFDLTSSHIVFQGGSPAGVLVDGIGAVMGPAGTDPEAMTWSFSTSDPSAAGIFSFQVADGATGTVPDGGTTAMLLGLGVLALGLLKKQLFV
jgi:protein with PEP-CTERM/exosortase system signal